ncbi:MAG TPA: hypothetical protein PKY12_06165, partial [Catalimonadaceae bacterium]|nr:hypothetical protein [Catalimonadaceae bacterium]
MAQQTQQLQMSDFVLFSGAGGPGTATCSSPGYAVQLGSSSNVNGGTIGSFNLIKTTGTVSITGNVFSKGTITLANSNSVTGKIAASNSPFKTGTIVSIGSNANLGGNIDVNGNIIVSGGTVSGKVTHPTGTTYSGPTPAGGNITGAPNLPLFPTLPPITTFPAYPQIADITTTRIITPGAYDDIKLIGNQTLTFKGTGVYTLHLIDNKNTNSFVFDFQNNPTGTILIYVHDNVRLSKLNVSIINGGSASRIFTEVHGTGLGSSKYAFDIANGSTGSKSKWLGTVWAPYAAINVGSGTGASDITGALWSGTQVNIQSGVTVVYAPFQTCTTPNANAGADKVITCSATTVQLNGSSTTMGVSYSWTASNGGNILSGANTATPTVSTAGTYTLTVTSGGCTATDVALVTLNNTPVIVNAGTDVNVCNDSNSVTLTATVTGGTGLYSYTWSNGMTTPSITVAPNVTTTYSVTVASLNGSNCSASDVVVVNVNQPLSVSAGADATVCFENNVAVLLATATGGTGSYTFEWFANNVSVGTGASISIATPVSTTYTVVVKDNFSATSTIACDATDEVVITYSEICPYYTPPTEGKTPDLIGSELFSLSENFDPDNTDSTDVIYAITDELVLIEVISIVGQYDDLLTLLRSPAYGLIDTDFDNDGSSLIITGFFPIANLPSLNELPELINYVRPAYPAVQNTNVITGLTTTKGDVAMRADLARLGYDLSGKGIKVGVLSDSYNKQPGNPALANVINNDLPADVKVLKDSPFGGIDEGRAMMQIIHDIAPDAKLAFRTGVISASDFAKGIKELQKDSCDIIVDDITYITEPFFQDGKVAQAVDTVTKKGVAYFTSAGNFGSKSYEGYFSPAPAPPGITGMAHNYNNGDIFQSITVEPGEFGPGTYTIVLQWEDPIYSLGQSTGTQNDLDIYLTNDTGATLFGFNRNNLNGDPIEVLPFTVNALTSTNIMIVRAAGSDDVHFKYIVFRGDKLTFNEHNTNSSTIVGQANAKGAITVGAVLYSNTEAFGYNRPTGAEEFTVASFSSI